jgi:hypothetical protein
MGCGVAGLALAAAQATHPGEEKLDGEPLSVAALCHG